MLGESLFLGVIFDLTLIKGCTIMTPAENLLQTIVAASEGTRKTGFDIGGVSYQLNQGQNTITGSFTLPVHIATNTTTNKVEISAQDFLQA